MYFVNSCGYVQFIHSLYNLESAAVFKEVDKNDIEAVQMFIRNQLYEILQTKSMERSLVYDEKHNSLFYGIFSSMREKFEFTVGDHKKLDIIINHVKEVVNRIGDYSHFDVTKNHVKKLIKSWDTMLVSTPAGLFFGDISQNSSSSLSKRNIEELRRVLIAKVKAHFESYQAKDKKEFDENRVTLVCVDGKYNGSIECLLCESHDVVVNYKPNGRSGSWLLSNLFRHIKKNHSALCYSSNAMVRVKRSASPSADMVKEMGKSKKPDETHQVSYESDSYAVITNTSLQNIIKMNNSIVEMKIEPIACPITNNREADSKPNPDELEDTVYLQCSTQIIKMQNACILNKEKDMKFYSQIKFSEQSVTKEVNFCQVKGDGNCLFAAIAHQLYQMKIDSVQHSEFTKNLRMEVVRHISLNLPLFITYLKGRVYDKHDVEGKIRRKFGSQTEREKHQEEIAIRCKSFVEEKLVGGTWGGTESIKAISEIYEVNILIINEDGSCNMVGSFNMKFNRTIIITYRDGNHYDSVSVMNEKTILYFTKSLLTEQNKLVHNEKIIID